MKKLIKIVSALLLLSLAILIITPILFKKQLKETILNEVNKTLNADFYIDDVSISFISDFPKASIVLEDILITNKEPFNGDTLVYFNNIQLETSIGNLISEKLTIDHFSVSNAIINLRTNLDNISNYDIMFVSESVTTDETTNSDSSSDISLHIEDYSFNNIQFNYLDEKSLMSLQVKNFNHKGEGTFSIQDVLLNTYSSIESITFSSENIDYIKNAKILWDADLNVNLNTLKVEFQENLAQLNDLKLSFHGFVQPIDTGIEMDINLDSEGSKFKSLLSLIPSAYSSDFESVEADGALNFSGKASGLYSDSTIPKFDVNINTNNASFHYPDLPKAISNIYIDTNISNTTGLLDDTVVSVNRFDLKIDKDDFKASSYLSNLTTNPHVKAKLKGTINLNNLTKAYPLDLEEELEGIVNFDLQSEFTQNAIEQELYENIKNSGNITVKNMTVQTDMLPNPITINNATLKFTPKDIILENFDVKTASSDLTANGTLTNLLGFVFGNKALKGNFVVKSNNFNVFDFLSQTEVEIEETVKDISKTDTTQIEEITIPKNIDITTSLHAKKVTYDNIDLTDMQGVIRIHEQKVVFQKTTAAMLGGTISFSGNVDTEPTPSIFDFSMSLNELDIVQSFSTLELFSSIAPFAKAFNGKVTTSLDLKGNLDSEFLPDMNSLTGNGFSKLQVIEIDTEQSNALSLLEENFNFVDFQKLDMEKIETTIKFENSSISFQPFKIASYDGIPIQMEGSHSFDNKMNYNLSTEIPVKFLGKEATNLLSGLSEEEVDNMRVPIKINLNGDITKPNIVPDYSSALKAVYGKVIESQKNKLLNSLFKESEKDGDSSNTENSIKETAKDLLKGLFN
ncbi:AsmA-like C-terminal region-containing protein [Flavicella sp.]|uniref:AsmA-like C-terminal region-containing protein n=1 Tax=Flavicella sp. TaxID=2957742 RepID=UPI003016B4F6